MQARRHGRQKISGPDRTETSLVTVQSGPLPSPVFALLRGLVCNVSPDVEPSSEKSSPGVGNLSSHNRAVLDFPHPFDILRNNLRQLLHVERGNPTREDNRSVKVGSRQVPQCRMGRLAEGQKNAFGDARTRGNRRGNHRGKHRSGNFGSSIRLINQYANRVPHSLSIRQRIDQVPGLTSFTSTLKVVATVFPVSGVPVTLMSAFPTGAVAAAATRTFISVEPAAISPVAGVIVIP